jgi:hypothetical protein
MKSFKYNNNKKSTATIEKKIVSTVKQGHPFLLETNITGDMLNYYVDRGGWVIQEQDKDYYAGTLGHIKNFLPFLGGNRKMALDKPVKRKYTRRTVKRGLV